MHTAHTSKSKKHIDPMRELDYLYYKITCLFPVNYKTIKSNNPVRL